MSQPVSVCVPAGLWLLVTLLSGQQPFRTRIDVVQVDVSVIDRNRRPVTGMTAVDFSVVENGELRKVVEATEITLAHSAPSATVPNSSVKTPYEVYSNSPHDGRVLVIVIDDATLPFDPRIMEDARKIGSGLIDRLGPQDEAAVLFTREQQNSQPFTHDGRKLHASVERLKGGTYRVEGREYRQAADTYYEEMSVRTVQDAIGYLSVIPNRRKAIAFISSGVPLAGSDVLNAVRGIPDAVDRTARSLSMRTVSALTSALQANVQVYSFDPAGLGGLQFYLEDKVRVSRRLTPSAIERIHQDAKLHREFLRTLSDQTGGRAALDRNDFGSAIDQFFADTGHYYLIAYESVLKPGARTRDLRVKSNRPGLTIQARQGLFAVDAPPTPPSPNDPDHAIAGLLPKSDIRLRVALGTVPGDRAAVTLIALGIDTTTLRTPVSSQRQLVVDTNVFTILGKREARSTKRLTLGPGQATVAIDFVDQVTVPAGRYQVRIGVTEDGMESSGAVYADLDVPDYDERKLIVSNVLLSSEDDARTGDLAKVSELGVTPTSRRAFSGTSAVTAFARVVQASPMLASTSLRWSVVDEAGVKKPLPACTADWKTFREGTSVTDCAVPLPLANLIEGEYLLLFEAASPKASMRREARFSRR